MEDGGLVEWKTDEVNVLTPKRFAHRAERADAGSEIHAPPERARGRDGIPFLCAPLGKYLSLQFDFPFLWAASNKNAALPPCFLVSFKKTYTANDRGCHSGGECGQRDP